MFSSYTRSIVAGVALFSILAVGAVPAGAQRIKGDPAEQRRVTRPLQRLQIGAVSDGVGAFLTWQSASESNVLGYNVLRSTPGGMERANPAIILGGGLKGAEDARSGARFQFFDAAGAFGSFYQIEIVGLDGNRLVGGTASAIPVGDITALAGYSSRELMASHKQADGEIDGENPVVSKTLAAETQSSLMEPSVTTQQWIAGLPAAKIAVRQDGIYRVQKTDLQSIGFNTSVSTKTWRLFADGNEQAIRVAADGSYIEFYGRARDTRESDTRVYYLVADSVKGKRMASVSARTFADPTPAANFANVFQRKYRTQYISVLLNGDGENYFGDLVSPTQRDFVLNLPSIDMSQTSVSLNVKLQGIIQTSHAVAVKVNGTTIGTMTGANKDSYSRTFTVPITNMLDGSNTISLVSSAATNDYSMIDAITVSYAKKFRAESNRLGFVTGSNKRVKIDGFSGDSVTVYDITSPEAPQVITNTAIAPTVGEAGYSVTVATSRSRSMYAVQSGSTLTPASLTLNTPSTLSATSNQARFLVVTHKNFMTEANAWAAYRAAQGYSTKVVDIEDIFDEFSFGSMSTDGMNAFFSFAEYSWSTNPDYVLIVGDATYDYRGYEAAPFANYVPTRLFDTLFEEAGSDDALVDFNSDGLAEIPIGRVAARTTAQVTQLFQKTQDFEATSSTALASRGALFAYDEPAGYNFQDMSNRLAAQLPAGTPTTMVYRYMDGSTTQNKTALVNGLNAGKYIVNYSGHGSTNIWANSGFFSATDATGMTNGTNLTVFTMLTCLNGYFTLLSSDSLAESLLKASGGGAAAAWASTGKTTPDVQDVMASRFYNRLSGGSIPRLGDLIKDAKTVVVGGRDVRLSWVLLGDPLLKMR